MNRVQALSIQQKTVLLKLYIAIIILVNMMFFSNLYISMKKNSDPNQRQLQYYQSNLTAYSTRYRKNQQKFEQYSFYENYDNLVFKNHELNLQYRDGVNNFTNITKEQFYSLFKIIQQVASKNKLGEISKFQYDYYDWSRKGVPIHDQRGFNVSHIFAVLTAIQYQINNVSNLAVVNASEWITLSVQQLIDCCAECMQNKRPQKVYEYIERFGVTLEALYPYVNSRFDTEPKTCKRDRIEGKKYFISGYRTISTCEALTVELSQGPLVVGIDGRNINFYNYGIFTDCERKKTHYAVAIGISHNGWKIQNSWGRKWGEIGYMRIGPGDTCGICLHGTVPIIQP